LVIVVLCADGISVEPRKSDINAEEPRKDKKQKRKEMYKGKL